jgi:hypothetical protein
MLSTTSSTAVKRVFRNCSKIDYCDKSDDDNEEEDNEDTSERTSSVTRAETSLDNTLLTEVTPSFSKVPPSEQLSNLLAWSHQPSKSFPKQNDDKSIKYKRMFGTDLTSDNNSLAEVPPSKQSRPSLQQSTMMFSKVAPSESTSNQQPLSRQQSKLFRKVSASRQSSTPLSHSSIQLSSSAKIKLDSSTAAKSMLDSSTLATKQEHNHRLQKASDEQAEEMIKYGELSKCIVLS